MLEGFTLFHGNKGWQLSTKQKGVDGWSVRHISDWDAQGILNQLDRIDAKAGSDTLHRKESLVVNAKRKRVLVLE